MKANFYNNTLGLVIVMLLITSCKLTAQPGMSYSTSNKKAIKLYEASRTCYGQVNAKTGRRSLSCAEENARKALEKDSSFTEAYAMLSQISIEKGEFKVAIMYKQKMMQLSQHFSPSEYFYLASLQMAIGDYEGAKKNATRYSQNRNANPDFLEKVQKIYHKCQFCDSRNTKSSRI